MAIGDDEFTCIRKSLRDLLPIQRRIAQAKRDDLMTPLLTLKTALLTALIDAVKTTGKEGDL